MEENAFEGMAPASSSSRVDPSFHRYDLFINHRGPDVKNTLASVIYHFLQFIGLKVFLDSPELQVGDSLSVTIQQAIRSSQVQIAIFSQGYADSPWCLAELELMLKTGAKIVPLFYDVKPHDLRYAEKGAYADAFSKYREKKRYIDKLEKWQQALHEASFITGIEFDAFNGHLGNLYKTIVDTVLAIVREGRSKLKLEIADHPVGLDEAIKQLHKEIPSIEEYSTEGSSIHYNNESGIIVGIVGNAGVGKTTLAKEFYNRNQPSYHRSSFLLDIGEAHRKKNMVKIQYKLMCDLNIPMSLFSPTGPKEGFGVEMIKSQLEYWYSKPLIIFDGVDHESQLEALAVNDFLRLGALVIVTCHSEDILDKVEVSYGNMKIYEMKGLEQNYARELFCWHAFRQSNPPFGREKLVKDILKISNGSPLHLINLARSIYSMQHGTNA